MIDLFRSVVVDRGKVWPAVLSSRLLVVPRHLRNVLAFWEFWDGSAYWTAQVGIKQRRRRQTKGKTKVTQAAAGDGGHPGSGKGLVARPTENMAFCDIDVDIDSFNHFQPEASWKQTRS